MNNIIDFYDIYDYYTIPFWQTTWFMVCGVLLLMCIICSIIFMMMRKKKPELPWQWGQQQLDNVASMPLVTKNDYKKFYFALTSIIKGYLSRRYLWTLDTKTDEELIAWLKEQTFNPEIITMLEKFADDALFIKFANADALKSQAETDLKIVHAMIEKTKEEPPART